MSDDQIKFLLVDDDKLTLLMMEDLLSGLGFIVFSAQNEEQCFDLISMRNPDIIILDILFEKSDGIEICKKIKSRRLAPNALVILYSGMNLSESDRLRGIESGADGYLNKRMMKEELIFSIQIYVRLFKTETEMKKFEWLLEKTNDKGSESEQEYALSYSDVTELNTERTIIDSVGKQTLKILAEDIMDLIETSIAVYEKNGDYAFGLIKSGWCLMMEQASRQLCNAENNTETLHCKNWLCHSNCWNNSAKKAMLTGKTSDIECVGGLRLCAEPIYAGEEIIGIINLGYGNPPTNPDTIRELSSKFAIDTGVLSDLAQNYKNRPPFIIEHLKRRLKITADIIGNIVHQHRIDENLRKSIKELEIFNDAAVDREILINDLRKEVNELLKKSGEKPVYHIVE